MPTTDYVTAQEGRTCFQSAVLHESWRLYFSCPATTADGVKACRSATPVTICASVFAKLVPIKTLQDFVRSTWEGNLELSGRQRLPRSFSDASAGLLRGRFSAMAGLSWPATSP